MTAPDHREALRAVEVRGARQRGDGSLRRVDQVLVERVLVGRRADTQEAVLRVDEDLRVGVEVSRNQVGDPDPEVHDLAGTELSGCASGDPVARVVRQLRSTSTST